MDSACELRLDWLAEANNREAVILVFPSYTVYGLLGWETRSMKLSFAACKPNPPKYLTTCSRPH